METDLIQVKQAISSLLSNTTEQVVFDELELSLQDERVMIFSPNSFIQNQINEGLKGRIQAAVREQMGKGMEVVFSLRQHLSRKKKGGLIPPVQMVIPGVETPSGATGLNPRFTLDDFVVGDNNAFAYQAALAVSGQDSTRYSPLFFSGDVGLGKSHISHAIGNRLLGMRRNIKARYITARDFSQEYVYAVQNNTMDKFKKSYRASHLDVFFVDDIHLFAKKEKTQAEFAGIMDDLISAGTQVILSGFRTPSAIPNMDKGLASRISSGLAININKPNRATRAAICQAKARKQGLQLSDEVAELIAAQVTDNIRELESKVLTLTAMSSIMKRDITMDLAREVLGNIEQKAQLDIAFIQNFICKNFEVSRDALCSPSRKKEVLYPRNVAIYLCRRFTDETLESIGNAFGRKHTSIMNSLEVIDRQYQESLTIKKEIDYLIEKLEGNAGSF